MIIADTGGIYKRKPLHLIRRCMRLFPSCNGHFPFNKDGIPVSGSGRFPQNGNVTKWSAGNAPISHLALEFIGLHHKSACNFETCRYNNSRCVWKAPTKGGPGKNTSLAPSRSACTLAGCTCENSMRVIKVDRSNLVFQRKTNYYIDSENDRIIG